MQAAREVGEARTPAGLADELRVVDGVALVVSGPVVDVIEILGVAPELRQDQLGHLEVVLLAVGPDEVGLADAALLYDLPDGGVVVPHVDPVADLLAGAVDAGAHAVDEVGDRAGDELLDVLVRAVVVRAVRDRRGDAEGPDPGADQEVGRPLGGGVRGGGVVGVARLEAPGLADLEVAVDLVGGDVVEARPVAAHRLQKLEGPLDVRADERARVVQRVVVVGLGCEVDHDVGVCDERVDCVGVRDVAHHQFDAVQALDGFGVAGVGELVEDDDAGVGHRLDGGVDEIGADEAGTASDENAHALPFCGWRTSRDGGQPIAPRPPHARGPGRTARRPWNAGAGPPPPAAPRGRP